MKLKEMIRPGCRIEAPHRVRKFGKDGRPFYAPSYRWVQGWQVLDPATGRYSVEMRYCDALTHAAEMLAAGVAR